MLFSIVVFILLGNNADLAGQSTADSQVAAAAAAQSAPPAQAPAGSNAPADAKEPPTPPHTGIRALGRGLIGDVKHLPAKENIYLALAGGAVAAAVHPVDQTFNVRLRSHYDLVNTAFAPAKYLGNTPEQAALS